jgi:diguanylate cyclase (GGDEF)-like protein
MPEQVQLVLDHIRRLLRDNSIPPLEGELALIPGLKDLHEELKTIREIVFAFSAGDLSPVIKSRGIIPGCLKALQADFRHMIWQIEMISQGDYSQQVQFLGEFSTAFNRMITRLKEAVDALKQREHDLAGMAENLRSEISRRATALEALEESENRFRFLAAHDPLTGALNRRAFMERAAQEIRNCGLLKIPCGIIMMNIDHFRHFNDSYGHRAGDEALKLVAGTAAATLRRNDFLGRYGGAEFVCLFCNAGRADGLAIAERIRRVLEANPLNLPGGPAAITASFGIAMAGSPDEPGETELESLIRKAGEALAGTKGRDRVICALGE